MFFLCIPKFVNYFLISQMPVINFVKVYICHKPQLSKTLYRLMALSRKYILLYDTRYMRIGCTKLFCILIILYNTYISFPSLCYNFAIAILLLFYCNSNGIKQEWIESVNNLLILIIYWHLSRPLCHYTCSINVQL